MGTISSSSGVYKILCIPTGKVYIGSTVDLRKRWYGHQSDLRLNKHHNRHLQFAWNKYGESCFTLEVLELVMFVEYLHEREQYWLDHFRAYDPDKGFNTGKVARAPWLGRSHDEETRQKLSERAHQNVTSEQLALLREQAAAWHRSAAGHEWHQRHGAQTWQGRELTEKVCEYCGEIYRTLVPYRSRFCSNNCKSAARRASRVDHEVRICPQCGQPFTCNRYLPTRCCSLSCAALFR